jgi:ABC-2 type transport system ATP-binding protein
VEALRNVDLEVARGEFVGLIGANGAGKTTLLKILSGLIPPSSGRARVLGFEPFTRPVAFRRRIALVMGQKAQLWWDLPAVDAFQLLRAIYDIPRHDYEARLDLLSGMLGVREQLGIQIRRLSLGERMKVELIGALLHWPDVVFLDEPTLGLDVLAAQRLRDFLADFNRREGATILLTSHNMEDISRLCPRVFILRDGQEIYDGPPSRLTRRGERRLLVRLRESPGLEALAEATGVERDRIRTGEVEPSADDENPETPGIVFMLEQARIAPTLEALLARYDVVDMSVTEQSLERAIQTLFEEAP